MEIWKDIEDFNGDYQVSSLGRIKSLSRKQSIKERILKLQVGQADLFGNLTMASNIFTFDTMERDQNSVYPGRKTLF